MSPAAGAGSSGRAARPPAMLAPIITVLVLSVAAGPRGAAARAQAAPKAPIPTCLSFGTARGVATCARSNANFCSLLNSSIAACGWTGASLLYAGLPPGLGQQQSGDAAGEQCARDHTQASFFRLNKMLFSSRALRVASPLVFRSHRAGYSRAHIFQLQKTTTTPTLCRRRDRQHHAAQRDGRAHPLHERALPAHRPRAAARPRGRSRRSRRRRRGLQRHGRARRCALPAGCAAGRAFSLGQQMGEGRGRSLE